MAVYLLHSTVPLVKTNGQAVRHYLGYCHEGGFGNRLKEHYANRHSSRIVQAFVGKGGKLWLGNYWPERTRVDERKMKTNGHVSALCLICEIEALERELIDRIGTALPSKHTQTVLSERLASYSWIRSTAGIRQDTGTSSTVPTQT